FQWPPRCRSAVRDLAGLSRPDACFGICPRAVVHARPFHSGHSESTPNPPAIVLALRVVRRSATARFERPLRTRLAPRSFHLRERRRNYSAVGLPGIAVPSPSERRRGALRAPHRPHAPLAGAAHVPRTGEQAPAGTRALRS